MTMTEDRFIEICESVLGVELQPWQESMLRVMFSAKREPIIHDGPITAQKLYVGNVAIESPPKAEAPGRTNLEGVRSSATEFDARVSEEAFDQWKRENDAEVLTEAANEFTNSNPRSWGNEAAYYLADMARDRREGRC